MSNPEPANSESAGYIGNSRTMVYHLADCPLCALASRSAQVEFDNTTDAVGQGYVACDYCRPDMQNLRGTENVQDTQASEDSQDPRGEENLLDYIGHEWDEPHEAVFTMEKPGLRKSLGVLAVIFAVAALGVTFSTSSAASKAEEQGASEGLAQGHEDGYQQGWEAAITPGYEAGLGEGDEAGYTDGLASGAKAGAEEGYAEGYLEGQKDGAAEGYILGAAVGQVEGEAAGQAVGAEDGYDAGYADGFAEGTGTGYLIRNPTYDEVLELLSNSNADTAAQICTEFEEMGIRAGFVWLSVAEGGGAGFGFVAFDTVDNGVIIMEPRFRKEIVPEVGSRISVLLERSAPDFDDTITRVRIAW